MSIIERATPKIAEIPEAERSIAEMFRIAARQWVEAEAAASILEDTKSAVLSQQMLALGIAVLGDLHVKLMGCVFQSASVLLRGS